MNPGGKVAGLILAAGESRRMGSPKALLEYRGETFLDNLIGSLSGFCSPVIVVLGHEAGTIRAGISRGREVRITVNGDYALGQFSSMQCGMRAVPPKCAGVLFTLVDHPRVAASTLTALVAEPLPLLAIPRYEGRRGHPVFFSRELIPQFLDLPPGSDARVLIRRYAERTRYLDVADAGVVADVDDPEAYRRLIAGATQ
ncbi:MAG: nucleotidyltransferase family protein [Bryobacteraceae bacterium]